MLAERVKEWTREWEQQGIQKGFKAGRKEGETYLLRSQLIRKYGSLTPQVELSLEQATPDQLLEWGERVLFAETIDQVFTD